MPPRARNTILLAVVLIGGLLLFIGEINRLLLRIDADRVHKLATSGASFMQMLALIAAGLFFWRKVAEGYNINNLSLSLNCERASPPDAEHDFLAIDLHLSKGERGTVRLDDIQIRVVADVAGQPQKTTLDLNWTRRCKTAVRRTEFQGRVKTTYRLADWESSEPLDSRINLPPQEETHFGTCVRVPKGVPCVVEAVVIGCVLNRKFVCQWKASRACLPLAPQTG